MSDNLKFNLSVGEYTVGIGHWAHHCIYQHIGLTKAEALALSKQLEEELGGNTGE